jgi:hypothetical protein
VTRTTDAHTPARLEADSESRLPTRIRHISKVALYDIIHIIM